MRIFLGSLSFNIHQNPFTNLYDCRNSLYITFLPLSILFIYYVLCVRLEMCVGDSFTWLISILVLWNSSSKYSFIDDMDIMSLTCPCSESSKSSSAAFLYLSLLSMISRTAWLTSTIRQHKLWNNKWELSFTLRKTARHDFVHLACSS